MSKKPEKKRKVIMTKLEAYEESQRDRVRTEQEERRYWAIAFVVIFALLMVFAYFLITVRLGQTFSGNTLIDFLPLCLMLAAAMIFATRVIVMLSESNRRRKVAQLPPKFKRRLNIELYIDMALILVIIYFFWQAIEKYGG